MSLQKRTAEERRTNALHHPWLFDFGDDVDTDQGPFMDTAAIMKNLDLVITSDTSIPHLAGALGVPTWLALPYVSDWRWLLDRTDSPWYPTMRLFQQKSLGDWAGVFEEIKTALHEYR
jgi:ADP-heptose:LPS heptosyltransferase